MSCATCRRCSRCCTCSSSDESESSGEEDEEEEQQQHAVDGGGEEEGGDGMQPALSDSEEESESDSEEESESDEESKSSSGSEEESSSSSSSSSASASGGGDEGGEGAATPAAANEEDSSSSGEDSSSSGSEEEEETPLLVKDAVKFFGLTGNEAKLGFDVNGFNGDEAATQCSFRVLKRCVDKLGLMLTNRGAHADILDRWHKAELSFDGAELRDKALDLMAKLAPSSDGHRTLGALLCAASQSKRGRAVPRSLSDLKALRSVQSGWMHSRTRAASQAPRWPASSSTARSSRRSRLGWTR